jgi:hypothetical protein
MSYRGSNTKFGNKTTSQIALLTGMVEGDTVFNTDYAMTEWYTGQVWTNSCSVLMTASATLAEGQCVVINASGQAALLVYTSSAATPYRAIGVVQYGGTTGQTVSIRTHGIAKCRTSAAGGLTIGQYAAISSGTIGAISNTASPGVKGVIGRNLETVGASTLGYVLLTFMERY